MDSTRKLGVYTELPYRTLRSVADTGDNMAIRLEASAHGHGDVVPIMQAEEAQLRLEQIRATQQPKRGQRVTAIYARGVVARYTKTGEYVTIMRANVGRSRQGFAMHEIVTEDGISGKTSEKYLEPLQ